MIFPHSVMFRAHRVPGCWEWDSTDPTVLDANGAVGMWQQKTQFGIFPPSVLVLTPVCRGCDGDAGDLVLGSSAMLLFPCTLLQLIPCCCCLFVPLCAGSMVGPWTNLCCSVSVMRLPGEQCATVSQPLFPLHLCLADCGLHPFPSFDPGLDLV